jgi:SAM-dependent methyltransferase
MRPLFLNEIRAQIGRTAAWMRSPFDLARARRPAADTPAPTIPTFGFLDEVAIEDGALRIHGWVAPFEGSDSGVLDGFRVTRGSDELACELEELRLASPDIGGIHPYLSDAAHCRFRLCARLEAPGKARTSLITCTPLSRGRPGRMMAHLVDPVIPMPSDEEIRIIGGHFLDVSCYWLSRFVQEAGLRPDWDVLDVGCGCGRIAHTLAHVLSPTSRYEGFDIIDRLVTTAQQAVSPLFPNFRFRKVDLHNTLYNPAGVLKASDFRFPYADGSFDFVVLISVFTHMLAADIRHYLDEIHRVLRPGGKCLSSCFLLNGESSRLIAQGKSTISMVHPRDDCFIGVPEMPEEAVGYEERRLLSWVTERGFSIRGKSYGSWCGRSMFDSYQDFVIYEKV